ncbi:MAG: hypothetical protein Q4G46_14900 [Propionibacteriaceae bacterium]|nr:hypothetical protein [Propionibacteriaceae bacterium]
MFWKKKPLLELKVWKRDDGEHDDLEAFGIERIAVEFDLQNQGCDHDALQLLAMALEVVAAREHIDHLVLKAICSAPMALIRELRLQEAAAEGTEQ